MNRGHQKKNEGISHQGEGQQSRIQPIFFFSKGDLDQRRTLEARGGRVEEKVKVKSPTGKESGKANGGKETGIRTSKGETNEYQNRWKCSGGGLKSPKTDGLEPPQDLLRSGTKETEKKKERGFFFWFSIKNF